MPKPPTELTPDRSVRHLLGAELRRHRELAGMSLTGLAEIVYCSKSHLSRVELAEYMPPPDLPPRLDAAFGTDGLFERLYSLARREIHPDRYRRRMEFEAQARVIEEYSGHLVPGLVQTEKYARAVLSAFDPKAPEAVIEERLTVRMGRQTLLRATPAPDLSVILDEAVIRRPIGGSEVMREQLGVLLELVHTAYTVVQVLPFSHGEHGLLGGSLTLLTLDDGPLVAYEESIDSGTLVEDMDGVRSRRRAYDLVRAYALSPDQSADLLRAAMEALP